jgi:hypothetical protein
MANLSKPEFLPQKMNKAYKQKRLVPKRDVNEGKRVGTKGGRKVGELDPGPKGLAGARQWEVAKEKGRKKKKPQVQCDGRQV